jgi:hypothetical protein
MITNVTSDVIHLFVWIQHLARCFNFHARSLFCVGEWGWISRGSYDGFWVLLKLNEVLYVMRDDCLEYLGGNIT